jgi:hypothetical protein
MAIEQPCKLFDLRDGHLRVHEMELAHDRYDKAEDLTSWEFPVLPELSPIYAEQSMPENVAPENTTLDFVHPLSYYLAPQTLHNPMSTLWDLSTRMTSPPLV